MSTYSQGAGAERPADRGGHAQPMLIAKGLKRYFPIRGGILNRRVAEVKAVDGISFSVLKGETLGVVGKSGCGKSTLARLLMHLLPMDEGELIFDGDPIGQVHGLSLRELRRNLQMVFQDSYSSLIRACPSRRLSRTDRVFMAWAENSPDVPRANCWSVSACGRSISARATRTNCPAARNSASTLPVRSLSTRAC